MTNYSRGADFERRVQHALEDDGYEVIRAAGSHGIADLVAFKPGQTIVVQAKINGQISPADRVKLLHLASVASALPIVAHRGGTGYRRLTGAGPRCWEPWTTDGVANG